MSTRRDNRIAVIQFLYMWDINPPDNLQDELRCFFESQEQPRDYYSFSEELIHGAIEHVDKLDALIKDYSQNWNFNRIAKIDLAVLRLALYELQYRKDIPPIVSINEAIDLSKLFSNEDSKRFINGILDKVKLTLDRPLREPHLN